MESVDSTRNIIYYFVRISEIGGTKFNNFDNFLVLKSTALRHNIWVLKNGAQLIELKYVKTIFYVLKKKTANRERERGANNNTHSPSWHCSLFGPNACLSNSCNKSDSASPKYINARWAAFFSFYEGPSNFKIVGKQNCLSPICYQIMSRLLIMAKFGRNIGQSHTCQIINDKSASVNIRLVC